MTDELHPIAFISPESLTGTHGVVWLARDGHRTTTQIATNVRYSLSLMPNPANSLGTPTILPPIWTAHLEVPRKDSFLHADTGVVLVLDDGRKALGMLRQVRGFRIIRAELRVSTWLENWQ